ncbi:MAG: XRE family transcriptional regulator [Acidobacteria bacterium]|nr:MAG: XRE family transcriptional regulator [Acidobacteriota bacterium]
MKTSKHHDKPFHVGTAATLGLAIRHYRLAAGLSQDELAKRAGLHRTYLSGLEQGRETEQLRRIFRVLNQLGVGITLERDDP